MRLIDADALKKSWSMGDNCEDCQQNVRACQYAQDFSLMDICEMLDEAPTVGGWISVKDRLPEINKQVLVAIFGHDVIVPKDGESLVDAVKRLRREVRYTTVGSLDDDGYWNGADGWPMVVQPMYWMPMPEPPKGDAQ